MSSKKGNGILFFFMIMILVVGSLYYFREDLRFDSPTIDTFEKSQQGAARCSLSACNCECYVKGTEPEMDLGRVCTKDCRAWENIEGCEYVEETATCEKVYKEGSGVLTRELFFQNKRYVPTDRIITESGFFEFSGELVKNTSDDTAVGFEIWYHKGDESRIFVKKETLFHVWTLQNAPFAQNNAQN